MLPCSNSGAQFESWINNINAICGPFAADPMGGEFSGIIEKVGGSGLNMSKVEIQGADLYRTPKEIRKSGVPDFFCVFQTGGESFVEQAGNRSSMETGDIVLMDSALPFRFSYPREAQQISLILPRDIIERVLSLSKIELGVKIPADSHIASFASRLVKEASLHQNLEFDEGAAILDSLATLIKPSVLKSISGSDPRDRVFRDASEFIKANIGQPGLNADMVANSIGVSVRSLYRVFSARSTTLSEFVKAQRLEMCAEYIRAHRGKLNLTEAAYRFGFCSSSYFSTAFKQRFGHTPSQFKKHCS
ncbi:transcriptional regulator FeaR [Marinobacter pelagius]|uniref:AraC family transcriptional regulator, positive regulator of tynA and feaB n=1 Tax=Marinobacter pelagius TaxID=379482 RepID=A0A1I4V1G9_9GAMM|nr:transcriptional regulator FeaR [Marinobacter pelagius]SFM95048.1 AraC family transcriptional regulator, positive regulator of tynA and feaB [Marinobacter pelagius]